jgi:antitoxin FitA
MSKMIQVRNVPERLHRELVRRARRRGQTLTDYIQGILERETARPLPEEVFERISRRAPVKVGTSAAELLREERTLREAPS